MEFVSRHLDTWMCLHSRCHGVSDRGHVSVITYEPDAKTTSNHHDRIRVLLPDFLPVLFHLLLSIRTYVYVPMIVCMYVYRGHVGKKGRPFNRIHLFHPL